MTNELPEGLLEELREAIAEAIRNSPRVRAILARAASEGSGAELALVVGVLGGQPPKEMMDRIQKLFSESGMNVGALEGWAARDAAEEDVPSDLHHGMGRRRKLRMEITPEDERYFRKLGLSF